MILLRKLLWDVSIMIGFYGMLVDVVLVMLQKHDMAIFYFYHILLPMGIVTMLVSRLPFLVELNDRLTDRIQRQNDLGFIVYGVLISALVIAPFVPLGFVLEKLI